MRLRSKLTPKVFIGIQVTGKVKDHFQVSNVDRTRRSQAASVPSMTRLILI